VPQQAIKLYTQAVQIAESLTAQEALGKLYNQQGQAAEARHAFQRAIDMARQTGDREAEARALNGLAFTLWSYDSYLEAYRTAASVLKLEGVSIVHRANAESHMGMVAWLMGQLHQAKDHCRHAVSLLKTIHELGSLGSAYSRLGLVYFSLGRLTEAEEMFNHSMGPRRALNDLWGEGFLTVNLGRIALERGAFDRAENLLDKAQQIFEKIESQLGLMVARTNQGQLLLRRGQPQQALPLLIEAAAIAKHIGKFSGYGMSEIYIFKARTHLALNDLVPAQAAAEEALRIVVAAGNQEYIAQAQLALAQIAVAQGQAAVAEEFFQKAQTLSQQIGLAACWLQTQRHYAALLMKRGDTNKAITMMQEARQEALRLGFHWSD
jgi:tetratricopeptide (TPR) repeat protein